MKKIIVTCFLLCCSLVNFAQEKKCSDFKNGTFQLNDTENNISYLIERNGKKQVEYKIGENIKVEFDVTWLSDCTYTLKPTKESAEFLKSDFELIVEIIEIKDNSMVLKMYPDGSPEYAITDEVEIIRSL
ncbi:hypothetical protein [Flavobacterium sp.]|uniref:hypothetical protein n=1 Tax=Flavobacterium sp. TaxID=239 RepID=UPI0028BEA335|nr:hypothetical protein [Flavobacterium sp.]